MTRNINKWIFTGKLLLAGSGVAMLIAALFFEHVMGLLPCIQCVYQRLGVLVFTLGALLALTSTKTAARPVDLILMMAGSGYALATSKAHLDIMANTNPFTSACEFAPTFPFSLPLDSWIPWLFQANGPCDVAGQWTLLGMSMPAWVFAYSLVTLSATLALGLISLYQVQERFSKKTVKSDKPEQ